MGKYGRMNDDLMWDGNDIFVLLDPRGRHSVSSIFNCGIPAGAFRRSGVALLSIRKMAFGSYTVFVALPPVSLV